MLSFSVSFTGGPLRKVRIKMTKDKAVTLLGELRKTLTWSAHSPHVRFGRHQVW